MYLFRDFDEAAPRLGIKLLTRVLGPPNGGDFSNGHFTKFQGNRLVGEILFQFGQIFGWMEYLIDRSVDCLVAGSWLYDG